MNAKEAKDLAKKKADLDAREAELNKKELAVDERARQLNDLIPANVVGEEDIRVTDGEEALAIPEEIDEAAVKQAEKRIAVINRYKQIVLQTTNFKDWCAMGKTENNPGNPYLTGPGAEKVASVVGIRVKRDKYRREDREDEVGKFYIYIVDGSATMVRTGYTIDITGTCSSRDKFFSTKYKTVLPQSEVDEGNILKAAITNLFVNGVTRLLGLRNLTWEDLKAGNIDYEKVAKVEYKKGGGTEKPADQNGGRPSASDAELMSDKQLSFIQKLMKSSCITDEERAKINKAVDSGTLTRKGASDIIDKLNTVIRERDMANPPAAKKEPPKAEPDATAKKPDVVPAAQKTEPEAAETGDAIRNELFELTKETAVLAPFEIYYLNRIVHDMKNDDAKLMESLEFWQGEIVTRTEIEDKKVLIDRVNASKTKLVNKNFALYKEFLTTKKDGSL